VTLDTISTVLPVYDSPDERQTDWPFIYEYAAGIYLMLCDSKPEDTQNSTVRSMKGDIICDFEKRD
jgi:hypothetical protein